MVKKTIVAVIAVVFLTAVIVGAATRWGSTRYGAVYYYGEPFFTYYPLYQQPYYGAYYPYSRTPSYAYPYYPGPLSSEYMYRYGAPSMSYPTATGYPATSSQMASQTRGAQGQLCGLVDSQQFGCVYGLVCDYTKTTQTGIGVCSLPAGAPATSYPYYYG